MIERGNKTSSPSSGFTRGKDAGKPRDKKPNDEKPEKEKSDGKTRSPKSYRYAARGGRNKGKRMYTLEESFGTSYVKPFEG